LNPVALLGGNMPIDAERSRRAIASLQPALPELDVDRIAAGIIALVDNEMAKVLRIVSIERGYDPRTFAMMAFGGGGPLHACSLAAELDVKRVIVPADPGLFSAFGLLSADIRGTAVRSILAVSSKLDEARVEAIFGEMEEAGCEELAAQGVAPAHMAFVREFDVRYLGQSFELAIHAAPIPQVVEAFHLKHERTYGYASRDDAVEIVATRLTSVGRVQKPKLPARPTTDVMPTPVGTRPVYFDGRGRVETPVYDRARMLTGQTMAGPAVIEQYDSCTLLPPSWRLRVDAIGNLELTAS
jgi:N-methylhydantoinase A